MDKATRKFARYEEIHEDYSTKRRSLSLALPANFRMLCAMFETSAEHILADFIKNLSCAADKGRKAERKKVRKYFRRCGYGKQIYSKKEIRNIFRELEARSSLYPQMNDKLISTEQRDLHDT